MPTKSKLFLKLISNSQMWRYVLVSDLLVIQCSSNLTRSCKNSECSHFDLPIESLDEKNVEKNADETNTGNYDNSNIIFGILKFLTKHLLPQLLSAQYLLGFISITATSDFILQYKHFWNFMVFSKVSVR